MTEPEGDTGVVDGDSGAADMAGQVRSPTVLGLPDGYKYGVTRYADVILKAAFPGRLSDLIRSLKDFVPTLDELRSSGGGRTVFVKRFDESLAAQLTEDGEATWTKKNIVIDKTLYFDGEVVATARVRTHEIDMFGVGMVGDPAPGVAVEMEWNNKDPFFDRDLNNFAALHREGAIGVGVIVTRGPELQALIGPVIRSKDGGLKYGQSTTHWDKLMKRVNLGGGGECPLLVVGIEPMRIAGIELATQVKQLLDQADELKTKGRWRGRFPNYGAAQAEAKRLKQQAQELLPPVSTVEADP